MTIRDTNAGSLLRATGGSLVLARAKNDAERGQIGDQHGGRVGFFLEVEDYEVQRSRMERLGVEFEEATRVEKYGKVAVFRDLYGNRWDLIEPLDFKPNSGT